MHATRRSSSSMPRAAGVVALVALGLCSARNTVAQPAATVADRTADRAAIRVATNAYLAALERGDGQALAALWTADGDIVDDEGRVMNGRETVGRIDASSKQDVRIGQTNLRFLTADVAMEDGTVEVTPQDSRRPLKGWFSATWLKQDGGWKLAGLRESRIASPHDDVTLDSLSWMVGDWTVVEDHPDREPARDRRPEGPRIELSVRWNPTRTFLIRELTIAPAQTADGGDDGKTPAIPPLQITQRIGWDPLSRQLVSWVFGSDGSHGEATWSREDDTWVARTMAVMPDGTQTSSLNIYTYDGGDRCTWRSIPTHVGGELAPHFSMTMVRKRPEAPGKPAAP